MGRDLLLVADVGGTKCALALAQRGAHAAIEAQHVYASGDHGSFDAMLADFLARPEVVRSRGGIRAACFAVAGPVADGVSVLTNLGWKLEGAALARAFGLPAVILINDFTAVAQGIGRLAQGDVETLQAGRPAQYAARLVIGAGTGLGVGVMTWQDGGHVVHASEAGHADFAPVDEQQDRLLEYLRRKHGRVSCERVVSGPGLTNIFSFLVDSGAGIPAPQLLEAIRSRDDAAERIAEFAASGRDPLAGRALDIFVSAYGAFAGNMALAALARGGVYVAGGIAPKIAARLRDGSFIRAFNSKGRFSGLLSEIPVHVVMNSQAGLLGAILEADRLRE